MLKPYNQHSVFNLKVFQEYRNKVVGIEMKEGSLKFKKVKEEGFVFLRKQKITIKPLCNKII